MDELAGEAFFIGRNMIDFKGYSSEVLAAMATEIRLELQKRNRHELLTNEHTLTYLSKIHKRVFKGLPAENHAFNGVHTLKYLDELLPQDWSEYFPNGDMERKYYVYAHLHGSVRIKYKSELLDLDLKGLPFYIGKGTGDRAYDLKRNQGHGELLRELKRLGKTELDVVVILKNGLTESEAFQLESKLIYLFGTKYETSRHGILLNIDIPQRPMMMKSGSWTSAQKRIKKRSS